MTGVIFSFHYATYFTAINALVHRHTEAMTASLFVLYILSATIEQSQYQSSEDSGFFKKESLLWKKGWLPGYLST